MTPTHLFYVVQYFAVPEPVSLEAWQLTIDGAVKRPLTLTYDAMRRLPRRTLRTVMECSGSDADFFEHFKGTGPRPLRREQHMLLRAGEFTGVPLAVVLGQAGLGPRARTAERFLRGRAGIEAATARGVADAPHADLVWCETATPDLGEAWCFAEGIHAKYPGKPLTYNCSPSFNWKQHLDAATTTRFQHELSALGYKFQSVTLTGFHTLNYAMFVLARRDQERGMSAYVELQEQKFASEAYGDTATRHHREVGAGYFDEVAPVITGGPRPSRH